jgi:hypothetical protein
MLWSPKVGSKLTVTQKPTVDLDASQHATRHSTTQHNWQLHLNTQQTTQETHARNPCRSATDDRQNTNKQLTCVPDMHTLAEVEVAQVCEGHKLSQAAVCDCAGNQPVVAAQGELLKHWQVMQVPQLGGADVLRKQE